MGANEGLTGPLVGAKLAKSGEFASGATTLGDLSFLFTESLLEGCFFFCRCFFLRAVQHIYYTYISTYVIH
jgi:hypothetical protein